MSERPKDYWTNPERHNAAGPAGNGSWPGMIPPVGQVETKQTGGMMEGHTLPIAQSIALGIVLFVVTLDLYLNALVIGYWLGVAAVAVGIIALCALILRSIKRSLIQELTAENMIALSEAWGKAIIGTFLFGGVVLVYWFVVGPELTYMVWPPLNLVFLPIWVKFTFSTFTLIPLLWPCALLGWRMSVEIFNGNWPPPYKAVDPQSPWTLRYGQEVTEDDEEEIRAMLQAALDKRDAPRGKDLLVIHNRHDPELVPGEAPAPDSDVWDAKPTVINVDETPEGVVAFIGKKPRVLVQDLRRYVAMYREVGLSFRKSKAVIGWGEETWRSAVLTMRTLGVFEPGSNGTEPKMAMGGKDALALIDAKLVIPKKGQDEG